MFNWIVSLLDSPPVDSSPPLISSVSSSVRSSISDCSTPDFCSSFCSPTFSPSSSHYSFVHFSPPLTVSFTRFSSPFPLDSFLPHKPNNSISFTSQIINNELSQETSSERTQEAPVHSVLIHSPSLVSSVSVDSLKPLEQPEIPPSTLLSSPLSNLTKNSSLTQALIPLPLPASDPLSLPFPSILPVDSSNSSVSPSITRSQPANSSLSSFDRLFSGDLIDLPALAKVSWTGIPSLHRAECWRLLLDYVPPNRNRRWEVLNARRSEYQLNLKQLYYQEEKDRGDSEQAILHQIRQDLPRTCPELVFFKDPRIQLSLERILFIFAIRHPATAYVQGMNDLLTVFFFVFFREKFPSIDLSNPVQEYSKSTSFPAERLSACQVQDFLNIESDSYWCLSFLIESIQENYTFAQPGIQRMLFRLEEILKLISPKLAKHLEREGVQLMDFAFRWINCLLMREISFDSAIRLFDTYLSEIYERRNEKTIQMNTNQARKALEEGTGDHRDAISSTSTNGLNDFNVLVCASLLHYFAPRLIGLQFQDLIVALQKLPTQQWKESDLAAILAQALMFQQWIKHGMKPANHQQLRGL
jgi:hypothetical protein